MPTTMVPSPLTPVASEYTAPPGRSPRPTMPVAEVQRNASGPLVEWLRPTTTEPSVETAAASEKNFPPVRSPRAVMAPVPTIRKASTPLAEVPQPTMVVPLPEMRLASDSATPPAKSPRETAALVPLAATLHLVATGATVRLAGLLPTSDLPSLDTSLTEDERLATSDLRTPPDQQKAWGNRRSAGRPPRCHRSMCPGRARPGARVDSRNWTPPAGVQRKLSPSHFEIDQLDPTMVDPSEEMLPGWPMPMTSPPAGRLSKITSA